MKLCNYTATWQRRLPAIGFALFALLLSAAPVLAQDQSTPQVKLYGFVLLNAAYNTGAPSPVDVPMTATSGERGSFLMTARQSRLGAQIRHANDGLALSGALEFDLWGLMGSTAPGGPTQSALRTRLAYFSLDTGSGSSFLFGQYWTVFAPLNPTSLAHVAVPALAQSGNLWNRLPQIRYTYSGGPVLFEAALLRPFAGEVAPQVTQGDYLSAGEYSKLPFGQARMAFRAPQATLGVSGHFGTLDMRDDRLTEEDNETVTYAAAVDLQLALGQLGLAGEAYISQNNRGLFGLAGTQVVQYANGSSDLLNGEATGGWVQASYTVDQVSLNAGIGIENVEDNGAYNRTIFGNAIYSLRRLPVALAVEATQIRTEPASRTEDHNNLTLNFAARYSF